MLDENVAWRTPVAVILATILSIPTFMVSSVDTNPQAGAETPWQIEFVDREGTVGVCGALAMDDDGVAHVAYSNSDFMSIMYANNSGGEWKSSLINYDWTAQSTLEIISPGGVGVEMAYYDYDNGDVKHINWTGADWSVETVDSEGNVGRGLTMSADSPHDLSLFYLASEHIGQIDGYTPVKATYDGSSWTFDDMGYEGNQTWNYPFLAPIHAGNVGMIVSDSAGNGNINYCTWDGAAWKIFSTMDLNRSFMNYEIALDDDGWPHMVLTGYRGWEYGSFNGINWTFHKLTDEVVFDAEISIDEAGCSHIIYIDATSDDLFYAFEDSGVWNIELIEAGSFDNPSLALDKDGNPHVSYYDSTNGSLKYAHVLVDIGDSDVPIRVGVTALVICVAVVSYLFYRKHQKEV